MDQSPPHTSEAIQAVVVLGLLAAAVAIWIWHSWMSSAKPIFRSRTFAALLLPIVCIGLIVTALELMESYRANAWAERQGMKLVSSTGNERVWESADGGSRFSVKSETSGSDYAVCGALLLGWSLLTWGLTRIIGRWWRRRTNSVKPASG